METPNYYFLWTLPFNLGIPTFILIPSYNTKQNNNINK